MNQGLEIIQEIEDIVSQEKMTPSKCTIVLTKLNLLRSIANSSNDIQNVRRSALRLPKDQKLVDKIVYELNDYHDMKMEADPNEEGYAIGIIEEVLKHYA